MAKKRKKAKKVGKKKHAPKKMGSGKTTTAEDEKAKTASITQWLRTVD